MQKQHHQSLQWLFVAAGPYRKRIVLACVLALLSTLMGLMPFIAIYLFIDSLVKGSNPDELWLAAGVALVGTLIRYPLLLKASLISHQAAYDLLYSLRRRIVKHMGRVELGYFGRKNTGALKTLLNEDVERIEVFIAHHLPDLISALCFPLFVCGFLFWLDWQLALLTLIPLPLALFFQKQMFKGFGEKLSAWQNNLEQMNTGFIEYLRRMELIKAFNLSLQRCMGLQNSIKRHYQLIQGWVKDSSRPLAGFQLSLESGLLLLFPVLLYFYLHEQVTLAELTLFLMLSVALFEPFHNLLMFGGMLSRILGGVQNIERFLDEPEQVWGHVTRVNNNTEAATGFRLDNVSFAYREKKVLRNISCTLPAGQVTAIIGPSGAGKTTLAQLCAGFFTPQQGVIQYCGIRLDQWQEQAFRDQVAIVFQQPDLLESSLLDNLLMGQYYSLDQVNRACQMAGFSDVVARLPDGYNTIMGGAGTALSGGEMQRLAITRAILKDAPVIILDEATAFADANSEALIQQGLNQMLKGKTVIIIAHRLQTITAVDQIILLDKGEIQAIGNHQALLEHSTLYQSLWRYQNMVITEEGLNKEAVTC